MEKLITYSDLPSEVREGLKREVRSEGNFLIANFIVVFVGMFASSVIANAFMPRQPAFGINFAIRLVVGCAIIALLWFGLVEPRIRKEVVRRANLTRSDS